MDAQSLLTENANLKKENEELRNRIPCSRNQLKAIRGCGKALVIMTLGAQDSEAYRMYSRSMYSILWNRYKLHFGLKSIVDTKEHLVDSGLAFINKYEVPQFYLGIKLLLETPNCFICEAEPGTIDTSEGPMGEFCCKLFGEPQD